jgi:hypothetical protein
MPVKLSAPTPDAPAGKPAEEKFDRFRPEMPQIPGVSSASRLPASGSGLFHSQRLLQVVGIAFVAVAVVGAATVWWVSSRSHAAVRPASDAPATTQPAPTESLPTPTAPVQESSGAAATVDEMEKPWAAKKFTFVKPFTWENIDAMMIRLPGGGLWAFSLEGPYGRCELEFVTDLATLATKYGYKASHPMVVNPCDSTVYDPLKVGPLGGNTWARGEIVQGSSLRPPISIDVKVTGRSIIADRIE